MFGTWFIAVALFKIMAVHCDSPNSLSIQTYTKLVALNFCVPEGIFFNNWYFLGWVYVICCKWLTILSLCVSELHWNSEQTIFYSHIKLPFLVNWFCAPLFCRYMLCTTSCFFIATIWMFFQLYICFVINVWFAIPFFFINQWKQKRILFDFWAYRGLLILEFFLTFLDMASLHANWIGRV